MVLFIVLYTVVLTFGSEVLKCEYSNESYWSVLSRGAVYYALLYRQDCFSGKLTTHKVHTKLHPGLVFSISSLVRISMTSFPALTLLFAKNTLVHIIKRKLHGGLKIWILFSRGKKQYFTHLLRLFLQYCLYHTKIKFISSHRCVISSIYLHMITNKAVQYLY